LSFAGLGRLDIIIVTVIGRGEQQSLAFEAPARNVASPRMVVRLG
jgi:hypothetical protein